MSTALFLGRFQPPHVGHLLTIRRLANRYDKVIVGATESEPSVMPVPNVLELLRKLLPDNRIDFIHVKGSVEKGTAIIDCEFDVCCSGNPAVLERMAAKGCNTEFVERSKDSIYSGTRERQAYIENAVLMSDSRKDLSLMEFRLVDTDSLRPIEKINPRHFAGIETEILEAGVMNKPLIVDRLSMAVLDGSHRYAFLMKHGYRLAPAVLCDYDDESIFVGNHLGHRFEFDQRKWISKQHVRSTAISGNLYEPRTTRHFFPFRKKDHPTDLRSLEPSNPRPIGHLIADVTEGDEIRKNDEYIAELEMELSTLKEYMDEQSGVLKWLVKQNDFIKASMNGFSQKGAQSKESIGI